jgi:phenylpropionate dioxygenase-like ring-hydroxylating dioxygenase large terminal subunit
MVSSSTVSGRCAATPQAPPPKSARLKTNPVQEAHGFIFAYWDRAGRAPQWRIPGFARRGLERPGRQAEAASLASADDH